MRVDSLVKTPTDSLFIDFLLNEGTVDFSQSETKSKPCKTYRVRARKESKSLEVTIENCETYTVLTKYREEQI